MNPVKVAIITGSTRPGRHSDVVARWVHEKASQRPDESFELVDIADYHLPLFDEAMPPALGNYTRPHTKKWAEKINSFDGFVFVTPEYNHSIPAALKNAIDFLHREWHNKAAGFVSYGGSASGGRAVEHLRVVLAEVMVATVRSQVMLSMIHDFENLSTFKPGSHHDKFLGETLDQVISWSKALRTIR